MKKFKSKHVNIFFGSDFHYGHKNICRGTSEWDDIEIACRPYDSVEEMNQAIVKVINNTVGEDDILFHLGDWSFGGIENIWNFRKQIKCKNIYLILGNHDHYIEKNNRELPNCKREELYIKVIIDGKPIGGDYCDYVLPQDLFTEVHDILKIKIDDQVIVMCHFPFQEWFEMDKGSVHLHGHNHCRFDYEDLNMFYKRMDVGLKNDDFHIWSWNEIKDIMKERKIKIHNS